MFKSLWTSILLWWDDLFDTGEVTRCKHMHNAYTCSRPCTTCGHFCAFHMPECRDVAERGTSTKHWYCRCPGFEG
jgi:hypothetical protein